jgi:hypothetical protein
VTQRYPRIGLVSLASVAPEAVPFLGRAARRTQQYLDNTSTLDLSLQLSILPPSTFLPLRSRIDASSGSKAILSSMATSSETPSTANVSYSLLPNWNEIRPLYLQPGSGSDKIRCIVKHVKLPCKASDNFRNSKCVYPPLKPLK